MLGSANLRSLGNRATPMPPCASQAEERSLLATPPRGQVPTPPYPSPPSLYQRDEAKRGPPGTAVTVVKCECASLAGPGSAERETYGRHRRHSNTKTGSLVLDWPPHRGLEEHLGQDEVTGAAYLSGQPPVASPRQPRCWTRRPRPRLGPVRRPGQQPRKFDGCNLSRLPGKLPGEHAKKRLTAVTG